MELNNLNDAWDSFMINDDNDDMMNSDENKSYFEEVVEKSVSSKSDEIKIPKCSDLHISTKTKIAHLNQTVNLNEIFWKLKVVEFQKPECGIIKKQMKISSSSEEELNELLEKIGNEKRFVNQNILSNVDNPDGRVKFKDVRKINIGISKKDIESFRSKIKSAFYNCFVLMIRIMCDGMFRELHVKVFNTGQLEIPGIKTDDMFENVMEVLLDNLRPLLPKDVDYEKHRTETILYNSNFNCGYYINRDKFYNLLKYKYNIQAIYDPCSYPGIQCKFYYNDEKECEEHEINGVKTDETKKKISFMIFRTGSTLIVGKCDKSILVSVYNFLKKILSDEFNVIMQVMEETEIKKKDKKRRIKKKIFITNE